MQAPSIIILNTNLTPLVTLTNCSPADIYLKFEKSEKIITDN